MTFSIFLKFRKRSFLQQCCCMSDYVTCLRRSLLGEVLPQSPSWCSGRELAIRPSWLRPPLDSSVFQYQSSLFMVQSCLQNSSLVMSSSLQVCGGRMFNIVQPILLVQSGLYQSSMHDGGLQSRVTFLVQSIPGQSCLIVQSRIQSSIHQGPHSGQGTRLR